MRHILQWFIYLRAHGLRKGDEHLAYTPLGVWHTLPFLPTYADNAALPAFVRRCCSNAWIISSPPGPQQQTCRRGFDALGQTDGQTNGHRSVS